MPTYSYQCKKCNHIQDLFHGMSAAPRVKCELCGGACAKLLGTGAGIIFKGSGFYETDYKRKGQAPKSESSSDKGGASSTSETKSDSGASASKSETKTESKPAPTAKAG